MIIRIDIPKWALDRQINILAGTECVAFSPPEEDRSLYIKSVRCSHCGECCQGVTEDWIHGCDKDGNCSLLKKEVDGTYSCIGNVYRPTACSIDSKTAPYTENCTLKFEKRPLKG